MRRVAAVTVLFCVLMAGGKAASPVQDRDERGADEITATTVLAVEAWVSAVNNHTPGRRDAAVAAVSALTFGQRRHLNAGMGLFLNHLLAKGGITKTEAEKHIAQIGLATRRIPGASALLKRAAVLHSDAAIVRRFDAATPPESTGAPPPGPPPSPLLSHQRLFLGKDGEILGEVVADWNWRFARSLLDLIPPKPAADPFVAAWYHATTAFMLQQRSYGEAVTHLERAAAVFPDDARVLFDRACYSEIQGLPVSQVLLSEEDLFTLRAQRAGQRPVGTRSTASTHLGIPPPEVANAEAERLFRGALRVNPYFVEARVRLARLLDLRKRHEEAAAQLDKALEGGQAGFVSFYAHLFAGRAAQALGRFEDAARHYSAASALFPAAQSALLAQSQLALLRSDIGAATAPISQLDGSSPASDPWWKYSLAAGRDADALLRDMWGRVATF
jgi:tetratricopeptide (TPR) repeat protein